MQMRQNERGFTLVELVVAVGLLSGVLAGIYYFFAFSMKSYSCTQDYYTAELSARNAVRTMSNEIRKAKKVNINGTNHYGVEYADASHMSINVYTDINNDSVAELVRYKVVDHKLYQGTAIVGSEPTDDSYVQLADKINNAYEATPVAAFSINGKRIDMNFIIKDSYGALKDEPVSVVTSLTVRSKGAMN